MVKKKVIDFEQQMQRLQKIVAELERMDLPLEQNVSLYKEGKVLAQSCKKILEKAKNEVFLLDHGEIKPFDQSDDAYSEEKISEDSL